MKRYAFWLLPIVVFIAIAPFTSWLDLEISSYFYEDGHFSKNPFFLFLFKYGFLPADFIAGFALVIAIVGGFVKKWRSFVAPALLIALTLAIGSGLIVHSVFKDNWGRPRPVQITNFGGTEMFHPFYQPYFGNKHGKSFPCGHCSTGFFFLALIPLGLRYKRKEIFHAGIWLSIIFGGLLSLTRIAQGGHFFSDTLAAALIMWYTALVLDKIIFGKVSASKESFNA